MRAHAASRRFPARYRRAPGHTLRGRLLALVFSIIIACIPSLSIAQAPGVDWRHFYWYWWDQNNIPQTGPQSGSDWWYDHTTSYLGANVDGFICAGFSSFRNWGIDEAPLGGCLNTVPGSGFDCSEFESAGNVRGTTISVLALIDPLGSGTIWERRYSEGTFFRVIQTADGGFLAIGSTASTRTTFTSQPLYYNPDQESGELTDQFDAGDACATGSYVRKIHLVKVSHTGSLQWQYLYGMTPYRDGGGNPDPATAHGNFAEGFSLAQTPDGGYLLVGQARDPNLGIGRMCMIKVDGNGRWKWGSFYGPTDQSSAAQAISVYGTGPSLRYVLSGTELFPGIVFNPYLGNMLYQRAVVMQFDGSVSGAPATYQWMRNSFDANYSASQNNFDVRIAQDGNNTILLPIIVNGTNCLYGGYNDGEAKVYRLDPATGNTLGSTSFGQVLAYDLKARVCPTPDGGFGLISSKRPACPPDPFSCYPDTRYWRTDAYVARCNSCGDIVWDATYDDGITTPTNYPGNLKLQECMYSISLAGDGGFVVSGNNSNNFDDSYLMKLDPEPAFPQGLYMQDTPNDMGLEPNPDTGPMWISQDIWVRNSQDDASFSHANQHQNPEYRNPSLLQPNYIYVRVRNRGCGSTANTGQLKVYTAAASTGLNWPIDWTNNIFCGGQHCLGEITSSLPPINVSLTGNGDQIFEIPWYPPDPNGTDAPGGHVCVLARVETPGGMTTPEGSLINPNVKNNNDIIWKNVTVVDVLPGIVGPHQVGVRNVYDAPGIIQLTFKLPEAELEDKLFDHVKLTVYLGKELAQSWKSGGQQGEGIRKINDENVLILRDGAWIGNMTLAGRKSHQLTLKFERDASSEFPPRSVYNMDLVQTARVTGGGKLMTLIGGERYIINLLTPEKAPTLSGGGNGPGPTGADGFLLECVPNPLSGETDIICEIPVSGMVRLQLYDGLGREIRSILNDLRQPGQFSIRADLSDLPSGSYTVKMTAGGTVRTLPIVLRK